MKVFYFSLLLLFASISYADDFYVDSNQNCNGLTPCYLNIQLAVINAVPDSQIFVFPGVYNEQVDLSQMGIALGPATNGNISFLTVNDLGEYTAHTASVTPTNGIPFTHTVASFNADVLIKGFILTSTDDDGIDFDLINGDITIEDVIANTSFADGIDVEVSSGGHTVTIINTEASQNGSMGFNLDGADQSVFFLQNVLAEENVSEGIEITSDLLADQLDITIYDSNSNNNGDAVNDSAGLAIVSMGTVNIVNLHLQDNEGPGLVILDTENISISDSSFERNGQTTNNDGLLYITDAENSQLNISRSTFATNGDSGIWFDNEPAGDPLATVNIECSSFSGHTQGMNFTASSNPNTNIMINNSNFSGHSLAAIIANPLNLSVNAMTNWWGDATGPTHTNNPGGSGEQIIDQFDQQTTGASGTVTFAQFLSAPQEFETYPSDTLFVNGFGNSPCQWSSM